MKTRQFTKILKENEFISKIKLENEFIKGEVVITRFRPLQVKKVNHGNIHYTTNVGNEVDLTFSGIIKTDRNLWYDSKEFNKNVVTRYFRRNRFFCNEVSSRVKLIGGKSELKIKKIELL